MNTPKLITLSGYNREFYNVRECSINYRKLLGITIDIEYRLEYPTTLVESKHKDLVSMSEEQLEARIREQLRYLYIL